MDMKDSMIVYKAVSVVLQMNNLNSRNNCLSSWIKGDLKFSSKKI